MCRQIRGTVRVAWFEASRKGSTGRPLHGSCVELGRWVFGGHEPLYNFMCRLCDQRTPRARRALELSMSTPAWQAAVQTLCR